MEIFWYIIISIVLCVFFILDGYDFGTGIIHLFFAKDEKDKEVITKAAGLFWDSNEVWLVLAGGLIFMAFPNFYASAFSGFYLPLVMVLWLIIFRGIGLELRGQFEYPMWKSIWERSFGGSSLLLALFFGVALGNIVRGVNLGGVENGVSTYESQYFFLPLWDQSFSPLTTHPGVIDWFTIIIGIISVVALAIHGANWIRLKTNASINEQLKTVIFRLNIVLVVLTVMSIIACYMINDTAFANFSEIPFINIFPVIYLTGVVGLFFIHKIKKESIHFLFSSMVIIGGITSTTTSLFPVILPSTNTVNESLTVYNTATSSYGMSVAVYWIVIGFILSLAYMVIQKRLLSGKIDRMDYGH